MIVYGVTVNESISSLFMAAMIPGILLAACFSLYVIVWSKLNAKQVAGVEHQKTESSLFKNLIDLLPVLCLIGGVIGSIYSGFATATEAAALGVMGALVLSLVQKSLTWESFAESVMQSVQTTCMIMLILMGAGFLSLTMGFTGIPAALAQHISSMDLSPFTLIILLTVFYIFLGCFLDGLSSIVLTMAVIEPMVRAAGFDMLWFGVYLMIVVEMAQITPPIGFNLFMLQAMTGKGIGFIARASVPMFIVMCLFVILLTVFPEIATWLPEALRN